MSVEPDHSGSWARADATLCLVQVHRDLDAAVPEWAGELVAFRGCVAAVQQALSDVGQAVQDAEHGRCPITHARTQRETCGQLGQRRFADAGG